MLNVYIYREKIITKNSMSISSVCSCVGEVFMSYNKTRHLSQF